MADLSVIIPARNEFYLSRTIDSILAAVRGDTEIIAIIDGEHMGPEPPADPRVRVIRHRKALGQRASVNEGAHISTAKFILKTDGHSCFDEGFDVKLMSQCDYDWTVLPTMRNIHAFDLVCDGCGKRLDNHRMIDACSECGAGTFHLDHIWQVRETKKTDWMWFRSPKAKFQPLRVAYWDGPVSRDFPAEYQAHKAWAKQQGDIADVMTGQGACWFMHRDRFWDLGGLDDAGHGSWGQMGVEIACKAWLSGGRQVVNRNTWFAHLFRCGSGPKFPYRMSGKDQERTRRYSIDFWTGGKWAQQTRPLEWLVAKFWPVPTWDKPSGAELPASIVMPAALAAARDKALVEVEGSPGPHEPEYLTASATPAPIANVYVPPAQLTVLYYTDSTLADPMATMVRAQLQRAAAGVRIVSVSQQHLAFGDNINVGSLGRSRHNIYAQLAAGLARVTTKYVALAEHDVLYPTGYFTTLPLFTSPVDGAYNRRRACLHYRQGVFSWRRGRALSQLVGHTEWLRAEVSARCAADPDRLKRRNHFEPGKGNGSFGLPPAVLESFVTETPCVDINGHGGNISGLKRIKGTPLARIDGWPSWPELREQLTGQKAGAPDSSKQVISPSDQPWLSVIIPARNEKDLARTVAGLHEHLATDYEILVGLDGPDEHSVVPPDHPRLRIVRPEKHIGMRPMINLLARAARGRFIMKLDGHCIIAPGLDQTLTDLCERKGHATAVAQRYDLDSLKWKRRPGTRNGYRYLSHTSEDGFGLRGLVDKQRSADRADRTVDETMTCTGSLWVCRRSTFVDWWGGLDERHGTIGQEGCEIACMTWLSGGRLLIHKGTWYAHHNRGKSPYALGPSQKGKSVKHSHWLWVGDRWRHQRVSFAWLLDHFGPVPGWPVAPPIPTLPAIRMSCLTKSWRWAGVSDLWAARRGISDPRKLYRLDIFWDAFAEYVQSCLAGQPDMEGRYAEYLRSHLSTLPVTEMTNFHRKAVQRRLEKAAALVESVRTDGLKAPLEFYCRDGHLVQWKGYRRLVILKALGVKQTTCRIFADRNAAGVLSPNIGLVRLLDPVEDTIHRLGAEQFRTLGGRATDKYWIHGYTRYYDAHFAAIRNRALKVLEVGLLRGASLKMWRDYFPNAEIVGADVRSDRWTRHCGTMKNTKVFIGDEREAAFRKTLADYGQYDVVIDDASHAPPDQLQLWQTLWPRLRRHGWYVIEDIHQSFRPNAAERCVPAGLEAEIYGSRDISEIHHYYNIVFIRKA